MPRRKSPHPLSLADARKIWLHAQRLDAAAPFGSGPDATKQAVEHLGYVQIDTINVIERSHHHILFTRIPEYGRADLRQAQSLDKTVFEYWTHALSYVPARDFRFFMAAMRLQRENPHRWFGSATKKELAKTLRRIRRDGALTIRDIDETLVEKAHLWSSKKPSKRVLELAFHMGLVTISARTGMLKTYELTDRHFGWETRPRPASERQINDYMLDRAIRAQGIVSLDSICFHDAPRKKAMLELVGRRARRKELIPVALEGAGKTEHWARPEVVAMPLEPSQLVHLLSPFDPLVIQRKRLKLFFGYDHVFEAYVIKEKRRFGYFVLPVLDGDEIVAAIDLKTDRAAGRLLMQKWNWVGSGTTRRHKSRIEEALHRFERFQLGT